MRIRSLMIAMALLAGLAVGAQTGFAKTTLTFGIPWEEDVFDSVFPRLVDAYNERNPEVEIRLESGWNVEKQVAAAAGGTGADVMANFDENTIANPEYQSAVFQSIDARMERHNIPREVFLPGSLVVHGGQTYGIKLFIDPNWPLFYNKTLMAEHGFDPERPPELVSEFDTMFSKLTVQDGDGAITRIAMTPWTGGHRGFMYVWGQAFGAKQWIGDERSGHFDFLTPEWNEMACWHQEYVTRYSGATPGGAGTGFPLQTQRFVNGQQVMGHSVTGHFGQVDQGSPYEWGLSGALTTPQGAASPMWFGGFRFGVSKFTSDADAAFDFLKFLVYDPEASVIIAEHSLFPAYNNAAGLEVILRDARWLPVVQAIGLSEGTPYVPPIDAWVPTVAAMRNGLNGGVACRAALETMNQVLNAAAEEAGYGR